MPARKHGDTCSTICMRYAPLKRMSGSRWTSLCNTITRHLIAHIYKTNNSSRALAGSSNQVWIPPLVKKVHIGIESLSVLSIWKQCKRCTTLKEQCGWEVVCQMGKLQDRWLESCWRDQWRWRGWSWCLGDVSTTPDPHSDSSASTDEWRQCGVSWVSVVQVERANTSLAQLKLWGEITGGTS
jgi:hypothetical protein